MEIVQVTHQVQYCPRCDQKNVSYSLETHRTRQRMECIACGNYFIVINGDSTKQIAESGQSFESQILFESSDWLETTPVARQEKRPVFSAINFKTFSRNNNRLNTGSSVKSAFVSLNAPYLGVLSVLLIALLAIPQLGISYFTGKGIASQKIDMLTTASIKALEKEPIDEMRFSDVKFYKIVRGTQTFINVRGLARNMSAQTISNPKFKIFVKNDGNETIHHWVHNVHNIKVPPGGLVNFRSESITNSISAKSISVMLKK